MTKVFRITTTSRNASGQMIFVNLECDFDDVGDIVGALEDGEFVVGERLFTRHGTAPGVMEIFRRDTYAVSKSGVSAVEESNIKFIDSPTTETTGE